MIGCKDYFEIDKIWVFLISNFRKKMTKKSLYFTFLIQEIKMLKFLTFIFFKDQIWLNHLMDDHHCRYITNIKKNIGCMPMFFWGEVFPNGVFKNWLKFNAF
jgi:hypothetical protein